jgi:hypothetical protein
MGRRLRGLAVLLSIALLSVSLLAFEPGRPPLRTLESDRTLESGRTLDRTASGGAGIVFSEFFDDDPLQASGTVVAGQALARLSWQSDGPAFPGDVPGSLSAVYNASLPAGWFGWSLPGTFDAEATFSAAAAFVIRSDGFSAEATGLDRTGSFQNFAADTFELIEFDYYPNVSPFFGGPFLAPSVFGAEVDGDAFANFTSLFDLDVALPLDTPLLAVLEHRPDLDVVVLGVHRIVDSGRVVPLDGAVGGAPLAFLSLREYDLDTIGLTLWKDSFGGPTPALVATLDFHAMTVVSGLVGRPEELLSVDDEDDDEDDE